MIPDLAWCVREITSAAPGNDALGFTSARASHGQRAGDVIVMRRR